MPEAEQDRPKQAVALRYDEEKERAPRVVAKGRGDDAETIIRLAEEAGVPQREDASLVEVLLAIDVDTIIPVELYQALAEILAWAYRQDRRAARYGL